LKLDVTSFHQVLALLDIELQILKNQGTYTDQEPEKSPNQEESPGSLFSRIRKHAKLGDSEIEVYIQESIVPESTDPLIYWKANELRFPNLAKIARKYLCIPATSGGVERVFSIAGFLGQARRSLLTSENVRNLIMYREFSR
jgi:hypothetical protein